MAIITFWSNKEKETGQSMSLVAIATSMAIEHNYKILIISTKYNDDTLELCFGASNKNKNLVSKLVSTPTATLDNGIEGLAKVAYSGRISPDIISNYTRIVFKNRLEVLYGYKKEEDTIQTKEDYLKLRERYKEIIQNANNYYDMVFVDLDKGYEDEVVKQILSISDVIVCNIEQKMHMVEDFLKFKNEYKKNNLVLNIGRFDANSKYSMKNVARYVGIRRDISIIPYNSLFNEAADEENVADLFLRIRKVSDVDRNARFVKEVQNAVDTIIYKVQEVQMKM